MRLLWFVLVIIASKDIEFEKVIKYNFVAMMSSCVFIVLLYALGIIEQDIILMARGMRCGIGLGHPNMAAAYMAMLLIQYTYIRFDKIKMIEFVGMFFLVVATYLITKSNTGIIMMFSMILFNVMVKYLPYKKETSQMIAFGICLLVIFFSITPIFYSNKLLIIDTALNGRLHQANYYFEKYGISIFGRKLPELKWSNTDWLLDIGYARMLLNNGIFYYVLIVGCYILRIKRAVSSGNKKEVCLISSYMLYMCTENTATYIFMNVSMLLFSDIILKRLKNRKLENGNVKK